MAVGEYGPVLDSLIIKSTECDEGGGENGDDVDDDDDRKIKNSKFQIKNIKITDIKHCIKHQGKDESQFAGFNGKNNNNNKKKKGGIKSQISQIWPTNFIYQFYCLYATNIIIFQKAYVSMRIGFPTMWGGWGCCFLHPL